jgi:hypothetical protein
MLVLIKFAKKVANLIIVIFFIAYAYLLIPAFVYMPILGLFAFSCANMSSLGALICVLGMLSVPLSMVGSLYFICTRNDEKNYFKLLFFCIMPFIFFSLGLFLIQIVAYFHDLCAS